MRRRRLVVIGHVGRSRIPTRRGICTHDHMVAGSYTHPDGYRAARLYSRPDIRARRRRAGRGPNRPDQTKRPAQTRRPDQADQERGPADEGRRQEADPGPGPGGGQEGHGRPQDGDGGRTEQGNQHQEAPGRPRRCIRGQPRRRHYMLFYVLRLVPPGLCLAPLVRHLPPGCGLSWGFAPFLPGGPARSGCPPARSWRAAVPCYSRRAYRIRWLCIPWLCLPCISHPLVLPQVVMHGVPITCGGSTRGGYVWGAYRKGMYYMGWGWVGS